jgi:GrpB-like predicted nucleotidyltransferase (UPF0157 family)
MEQKMSNNDNLNILYPIFLTEFNDNWREYFEEEKAVLYEIFDSSLKIEHIGSTAIPGLSAKPTIDILLEKPKTMNDDEIIEIMGKNGYIHMLEQTRHLMFVKGYSPQGLEKKSFHIHIGPLRQNWLWDRIYFRDYLRLHHDEALQYEELKKELAVKFQYDRETYTNGKTDYIYKITKKAKKELS